MEHARATREEERENNVSNFPFAPPNLPWPAWQAFQREGERERAGDHVQGRREEGDFLSFLPRAAHALSRAQISPSPFNACHVG